MSSQNCFFFSKADLPTLVALLAATKTFEGGHKNFRIRTIVKICISPFVERLLWTLRLQYFGYWEIILKISDRNEKLLGATNIMSLVFHRFLFTFRILRNIFAESSVLWFQGIKCLNDKLVVTYLSSIIPGFLVFLLVFLPNFYGLNLWQS